MHSTPRRTPLATTLDRGVALRAPASATRRSKRWWCGRPCHHRGVALRATPLDRGVALRAPRRVQLAAPRGGGMAGRATTLDRGVALRAPASATRRSKGWRYGTSCHHLGPRSCTPRPSASATRRSKGWRYGRPCHHLGPRSCTPRAPGECNSPLQEMAVWHAAPPPWTAELYSAPLGECNSPLQGVAVWHAVPPPWTAELHSAPRRVQLAAPRDGGVAGQAPTLDRGVALRAPASTTRRSKRWWCGTPRHHRGPRSCTPRAPASATRRSKGWRYGRPCHHLGPRSCTPRLGECNSPLPACETDAQPKKQALGSSSISCSNTSRRGDSGRGA
jgi:hypothetical protein